MANQARAGFRTGARLGPRRGTRGIKPKSGLPQAAQKHDERLSLPRAIRPVE